MKQAAIEIQGMSCGHCVASVKRALGALPGEVASVDVGSAHVRYDPVAVSPEQIAGAVEEEGYSATLSNDEARHEPR